MRSSRAAAIEHVAGTAAAIAASGLQTRSGTPLEGALARLAAKRRPQVDLDCQLPAWLVDARVVPEQWMAIIGDRLAAVGRPRQPFVLLAHLDADLDRSPPPLAEIENRLGKLSEVPRLDERVGAAIIGVPVLSQVV